MLNSHKSEWLTRQRFWNDSCCRGRDIPTFTFWYAKTLNPPHLTEQQMPFLHNFGLNLTPSVYNSGLLFWIYSFRAKAYANLQEVWRRSKAPPDSEQDCLWLINTISLPDYFLPIPPLSISNSCCEVTAITALSHHPLFAMIFLCTTLQDLGVSDASHCCLAEILGHESHFFHQCVTIILIKSVRGLFGMCILWRCFICIHLQADEIEGEPL